MTVTDIHVGNVDPARQKQRDYTNGLRALADFLDANPIFMEPYGAGVTVHRFVRSENDEPADDTVARFRALSQLLDEPTFRTSGNWFNSSVWFGPHELQVTMNRDVLVSGPPHPLA